MGTAGSLEASRDAAGPEPSSRDFSRFSLAISFLCSVLTSSAWSGNFSDAFLNLTKSHC